MYTTALLNSLLSLIVYVRNIPAVILRSMTFVHLTTASGTHVLVCWADEFEPEREIRL